jgi:prepilin-type N-terminal cleavage/methylation domain-containing protein
MVTHRSPVPLQASRAAAARLPGGGHQAQTGFSLVELAIAIALIGLLLGGILVPVQSRVEERQVRSAQQALENIREAMLGFAAVNGYLPCPDATSGGSSNDGTENFSGSFCSNINGAMVVGNVPWATLGVPETVDPWGNRYRYAVIENYARRANPSLMVTLGTFVNGALRICTTSACAAEVIPSTGDKAVAVILSHGRNGWGAINSLTNTANSASTSADELENSDNDKDFVYRERTAAGATAGEFDDVVVWLSRPVLMNRMVAAGKLP